MRPTEMLLGALGGCTGVNAVLLLKKFKQPLRTLEIEVDGDREEEWPKAFKSIRITFHCTWDGEIDKKLVDQAIDWATSFLSISPSHVQWNVIRMLLKAFGHSSSRSPSTSISSVRSGCLNFFSRSTAFTPVHPPSAPSSI